MKSSPESRKAEYERLRTRRTALLDRISAIRADLARGLDQDSSERAVELENADVLHEIARVAEEELEQIEAALGSLRGVDKPDNPVEQV